MNNLPLAVREKLKLARVELCGIVDHPFARLLIDKDTYEEVNKLIATIEKLLGVM